MIGATTKKLRELFDLLRFDSESDRSTRGTPRGRFEPSPTIAAFDTAPGCGQPLVAGPVAARSTCAHHFMPIHSETGFGILASPGGNTIGRSTYDRIVKRVAARLRVQRSWWSRAVSTPPGPPCRAASWCGSRRCTCAIPTAT